MEKTEAVNKNTCLQLKQIYITDTKTQAWVYFVLKIMGNITQAIPDPLTALYLVNIASTAIEEQNLFDRFLAKIISKAIEGSITNTLLKKLRLH